MNNKYIKIIIGLVALSVVACNSGFKGSTGDSGAIGSVGAPGPQGPNGETGSPGLPANDGQPGLNGVSLVTVVSPATALQCPTGGNVISFYQDNAGTGTYQVGDLLQSEVPLCNGAQGLQGIQGPVATPAPVSPQQQQVNDLMANENSYRQLLGQTTLTSGLSCSVQAIASGQWLSSSSPGYQIGQGVLALTGTNYTYLYQGNFNQPNTSQPAVNTLLPIAIQPLFANNNYKISCSGQLVVTQDGYYNFDVNSDDGSILTVNGTQVVNNDGNHGMSAKSGTTFLRAGVRTFSLLYAQSGNGNFGLIVQANGSLIDSMYYYH